MIEFDAYAPDCRLYGEIELERGRLVDQLNCTMEILIRDARIADLGDGHVVELPELTVGRDELCAVVATGPRGDEARRLNTRTTRVETNIGPYRVEGWAHSPPAADPVASILRRGAWVPLTDATVWYSRCGEDVKDKVPALLVNRHLMRTFRAAKEARPDLPTLGGSPSSTTTAGGAASSNRKRRIGRHGIRGQADALSATRDRPRSTALVGEPRSIPSSRRRRRPPRAQPSTISGLSTGLRRGSPA